MKANDYLNGLNGIVVKCAVNNGWKELQGNFGFLATVLRAMYKEENRKGEKEKPICTFLQYYELDINEITNYNFVIQGIADHCKRETVNANGNTYFELVRQNKDGETVSAKWSMWKILQAAAKVATKRGVKRMIELENARKELAKEERKRQIETAVLPEMETAKKTKELKNVA